MWKYQRLPYSEMMAKQFSYLDKIDFKPYIDKHDDLNELMQSVADDYNDSELTQNDFLDGCVFAACDEYELSKYIKDKYGVDYTECTISIFRKRK